MAPARWVAGADAFGQRALLHEIDLQLARQDLPRASRPQTVIAPLVADRGNQGMLDAATYSVVELLRNGREVEIRALRPEDRTELTRIVARSSTQSLYRRFFTVKRNFSDQEIEFFLNIDFVNHVALVAVLTEDGRPAIVGGARYIVIRPSIAEMAFMVVDDYRGQGIGSALLRNLAAIARDAGITELFAAVLPDNMPMLTVFKKSGYHLGTTRKSDGVDVVLTLCEP